MFKSSLNFLLLLSAVNSNWVFVGTERGNTHVLKLDTFSLSGYIINWNKAIGVMASAHPGSVTHILGEISSFIIIILHPPFFLPLLSNNPFKVNTFVLNFLQNYF